ncbi:ash family protein [Salmonella enterica]|nr:ash family protein [Salmonella enterica]EHR1669725.1 ash family protein [Salmonella enterica]EHR8096108.1 ash family protein [Salmonella enterica]EIE9497394.1 ash family protein [Salmonella enterica]EIQ5375084.1 ash family protein [Salmonella enterica]
MPGQSKKSLNTVIAGCYIFPAITVLMVGCGSSLQLQATKGASCAFFVVVKTIFAIKRHFMAWCIHIRCAGYQTDAHGRMYHATMSMVAQAGPTSVGPVSCNAGTSTPVWAIASKCGSFSDSMTSCYRRLPLWLRPQPKNTQNPRSPNSATTAAVRFSASKIFHSGYTLALSILRRWLLRILFMPFPTSTTILRL